MHTRSTPLALFTLALALVATVATSDTKPGDTGDTGDSADTGTTTDTGALTPAPDLGALVNAGGCSDLAMTLGSDDKDLVLIFTTSDVTTAAYDAKAGTATVTLDLATDGSLELWQGIDVTNIPCNDALYGTEVVVTTWTVVSGTAEVSVVSSGEHEPWDEYPGDGTLSLTDVVLSADGAEDVTIDSLSWTAWVGWLPG
jgi:hypothetical protein